MGDETEQVAEAVAEEITSAIASANDRAEERAAVAEAIIDGALETERARQVRDLERDMLECLDNQRTMAEAMTTLSTTVETVQEQLTALQSRLLTTSPESDAAAGQKENPAPAVTVEVETPEAPPAEPPPENPPPARRKRRFL